VAEFKKYCPRCDRVAISEKSEEDALKIIADHMDRAHPDMDNYIREDNPL
jgi:predicted small metal-binding protein